MSGKVCLVLLIAFTISACSGEQVKDESSPFYSVKKGSRLVLNQDITIPPNRSSVFLQDGMIKNNSDVDIYYPNCVFEVKSLTEKPRTVRADSFLIHKVIDQQLSVSLDRVLVAGLGFYASGGNGSTDYNYTTTFYLKSDKQRDVLRMACRSWQPAEDGYHLSIKKMRTAIGNIFTLVVVD